MELAMVAIPRMRGSVAAVPRSGGRSVVFAGLLALLCAIPAAAQFSAQPVILEMRTGADAASAVFMVRNESDGPLQLRVYGSDFDQPEEGGHEFMAPGTHGRSCADRLEFVPGNLVLDPRGAGEVRVRMAPGDSTCWSLVFVESVSRGAAGIRIAQRIGVKVYGVGAGIRSEGEIREVRVVVEPDGSRAVELAFTNTGGAPVRPEGEVEIRSEAGDVVGVLAVPPFSVLPGRSAWARVALGVALGPGRYLVVPILDFGGDYLAGAQAVLEIGAP